MRNPSPRSHACASLLAVSVLLSVVSAGCLGTFEVRGGGEDLGPEATIGPDLAPAAPAPASADMQQVAQPTPADMTPGSTPTITVASPVSGGKVILRSSNTIAVPFTVTNANLCPEATPDCARVCLQIDGDACNIAGKPCNVGGTQSPLIADLSLCPAATRNGAHTLTVALQTGLKAPIVDGVGTPIAATVPFAAAVVPTVAIASPATGATVTMNATTGVVPVTVNLTGFSLAAAGACKAGDETCGRVCLKIDGDACNATGKPCNVAGTAAGALNANFKSCAKPTGPHAISVYLVDDAGIPIDNAAGTLPIQSIIAVTAN